MKQLLTGWIVISVFLSAPAAARPPWFDSQQCNDLQNIHAHSVTDQYRYDASGNIVQSLWDSGKINCVLELNICGDRIFKSKVIDRDTESCPPELNGEAYRGEKVCCDQWKRAKQSNSPCNPVTDADCDGIANYEDSSPTGGGTTAEPPPAKKGEKTLHADLRVIIRAPHRFPLGVTPFAVVVKNYGPGQSPAVRLTGSTGLGTLNYATTSQGNCSVSGTSLNCEFGTLQSGETRSVSVQLRTETEGEAVLTADVTGGAQDMVTENNHAEHSITVKKATQGTIVNP